MAPNVLATTISVSQTIEASRASIWHAVSDARSLTRWQADDASGGLAQGGFVLRWPSLGAEVALEVAAAEPERWLLLRNGESSLDLRIDDGHIELSHHGLSPDDDLEGMKASWQIALGLLAHYLGRHEGQDRQVTWVARRITTTAELAHVFFTDRAALGSWLSRSDGGIGEVGAPVHLTSQWGEAIDGRVLVKQTGRDVAMSLAGKHDGVLVLRTLPAPASDTQRLVALVWSRWGARAESALPHQLAGALSRLKWVLESVGQG